MRIWFGHSKIPWCSNREVVTAMLESIKTCFGKYIDFSGRASRSEFWWFLLFHLVGTIGLSWIEIRVFSLTSLGLWVFLRPSSLFFLATILPLLAVGWRRLHDTGHRGWFIILPIAALELGSLGRYLMFGFTSSIVSLLIEISFLLALIILVEDIWWLVSKGNRGANKYGPPDG